MDDNRPFGEVVDILKILKKLNIKAVVLITKDNTVYADFILKKK